MDLVEIHAIYNLPANASFIQRRLVRLQALMDTYGDVTGPGFSSFVPGRRLTKVEIRQLAEIIVDCFLEIHQQKAPDQIPDEAP